VGPFEEEEEGTGVASDVVKVEGEDPATPGYYLRSVEMKGRGFFFWFPKTKNLLIELSFIDELNGNKK